MSTILSPVTFHGDTIFCTTYQNQPYTAMKPIIENMGLDWRSQQRKLTGCAERWGIVIMTIPSSGGDQETLCMPVRKLPAFLNAINPKKVRPELRERIELYQNESDDVLWEYWTNQQNAPTLPPLSTVEDRRKLNNLVREWAALSGQSFPDCWAEVHTAFDIEAVADLPAALVRDAEKWVQARLREYYAPAPVAPDFPLELANCGRKGKEIVNLWAELEDLKKKLAWCNNMVFLACSEGRLMCLTAEKNLLHTILKESVKAAQDSLSMAQNSVQAALRIKAQVDFHTI